MHNYIILNEQNVIVGISTLNSIVNSYDMVLMENVDMSMLLKTYNRESGAIE